MTSSMHKAEKSPELYNWQTQTIFSPLQQYTYLMKRTFLCYAISMIWNITAG